MTAPTIEVGVALGVAEAGDFIIGDPVRGMIGSTDYLIGSGYTPVAPNTYSVSIRRGRWSRLWDAFEAGSVSINLWNHDRSFDPSYLISPYSGHIVPGRGVQIKANDIVIATAFVDDWNLDYDVSGQSSATLSSTDALGALGQVQLAATWSSTGLSANTKLSTLCELPEIAWPAALRVFDEGVETLQADSVTAGSSVAAYLGLIGRSDGGMVFVDADGVLTFRNSLHTLGAASVLEFSDDDAVDSVPFAGISATVGSELLFSHVTVESAGGTVQAVEVADLAEWRRRYGPYRSLSISGLLLSADADALAMATNILALYDTPRYRVSEIRVELAGLTSTQQDAVLALDITDTVGVTFTPNGVGDPIISQLVIQGIAHDIGTDRHSVTFSLIDAPTPRFRIGDAVYGLIGSVYLIGF